MNAKFKAENPNDIEMTLTVTMPLADWKRLMDQVKSSSYPSWRLYDEISKVVRYAEEHFEPKED